MTGRIQREGARAASVEMEGEGDGVSLPGNWNIFPPSGELKDPSGNGSFDPSFCLGCCDLPQAGQFRICLATEHN